jgi:hypothetical protein
MRSASAFSFEPEKHLRSTDRAALFIQCYNITYSAFDARQPRPWLAVLGERAFVSDPKERRIREFDLKTLKQGLDMPVDGAPGHLARAH